LLANKKENIADLLEMASNRPKFLSLGTKFSLHKVSKQKLKKHHSQTKRKSNKF